MQCRSASAISLRVSPLLSAPRIWVFSSWRMFIAVSAARLRKLRVLRDSVGRLQTMPHANLVVSSSNGHDSSSAAARRRSTNSAPATSLRILRPFLNRGSLAAARPVDRPRRVRGDMVFLDGWLGARNHTTRLPERIAAGADSRRMAQKSGSLHGNAPDTCPVALLVIDMINDLEFEGGQKLLPGALRAAKRIAALKRRARDAGVPVIYTN